MNSGDTLAKIVAGPYESLTTIQSVATASNLDNANTIYTGTVLTIPISCSCGDPSVSPAYGVFTTYLVKQNDSLSSIASILSIDPALVSKYNPFIKANQLIFVPTKGISKNFSTMKVMQLDVH